MIYAALIRAINVGGRRAIKMAELREMFTAAGAHDVVTYITSGNVVFDHAESSATKLTARLERTISKATGFDVSLVLRTGRELTRVVEANPFPEEPTAHIHVVFLHERVPARALDSIDPRSYEPERFVLRTRELYVFLPNGVGRSDLAGRLVNAKAIGGGTMRNWRTVTSLVDLMAAQPSAVIARR